MDKLINYFRLSEYHGLTLSISEVSTCSEHYIRLELSDVGYQRTLVWLVPFSELSSSVDVVEVALERMISKFQEEAN